MFSCQEIDAPWTNKIIDGRYQILTITRLRFGHHDSKAHPKPFGYSSHSYARLRAVCYPVEHPP